MNYAELIRTCLFSAFIALGLLTPCLASTTDSETKPLILDIDLTEILTFNQTEKKLHTFEKPPAIKSTNKVFTKIKRAKKALNKITSFKYNKKHKLKAHLGKSSCLLQYTHKL